MSDMSRAMETELRGLGIPFFAIKPDLIAPEAAKREPRPGSGSPPISESKSDGLSAEKLRAFKERMFDLLEDLCKE